MHTHFNRRLVAFVQSATWNLSVALTCLPRESMSTVSVLCRTKYSCTPHAGPSMSIKMWKPWNMKRPAWGQAIRQATKDKQAFAEV